MTDTERMMITKDVKESENEIGTQNKKKSKATLKSLFCRLYLVAFCIYIPAYNLSYYNLFSVVPFYLNKVLGAEPLFISYINIALSILIAFSTLTFSFVYRKLDKKLDWLKCRMLFTILPMMIQIVLLISLSNCSTIPGQHCFIRKHYP